MDGEAHAIGGKTAILCAHQVRRTPPPRLPSDNSLPQPWSIESPRSLRKTTDHICGLRRPSPLLLPLPDNTLLLLALYQSAEDPAYLDYIVRYLRGAQWRRSLCRTVILATPKRSSSSAKPAIGGRFRKSQRLRRRTGFLPNRDSQAIRRDLRRATLPSKPIGSLPMSQASA